MAGSPTRLSLSLSLIALVSAGLAVVFRNSRVSLDDKVGPPTHAITRNTHHKHHPNHTYHPNHTHHTHVDD